VSTMPPFPESSLISRTCPVSQQLRLPGATCIRKARKTISLVFSLVFECIGVVRLDANIY